MAIVYCPSKGNCLSRCLASIESQCSVSINRVTWSSYPFPKIASKRTPSATIIPGIVKIMSVLHTLSNLAYKAIKKNGEFVLHGFGKIVKQKRKARTGFNPKTQQKIKIPAKTVVFYKCTSVLSLKNVTIAQFLLCSGDGAPDSAATSDRGRSS